MSPNHTANTVFQLRNDFSAAVVGRWVGRKQNHHVDFKPHGITADLHVAFFKNVEQTDLDQFVQLWQFINRKNPSMHPWNQTKMQRIFGRHARTAGKFRRINFTDDVRELGSRSKSFRVAIVAMPPLDRHLNWIVCGDEVFGDLTERIQWVLVKWSGIKIHVGDVLVQKTDQPAHQAAFCLALFSQIQHIVLRQQRDVDLGNHRVFIANDPRIKLVTAGELFQKVLPDLLLDRFGLPTAVNQLF